MLEASKYNLAIPIQGRGSLLFNSKSGAIVQFPEMGGREFAKTLAQWSCRTTVTEIGDPLASNLLRMGFLRTSDSADEISMIQETYWRARGYTPMTLTLTTTQDCNLGCFYCYEGRTEDRLNTMDLDAVVDLVRAKVSERKHTSLHVDWYGGEPMLNIEFIESCSMALQDLCDNLGIAYHASAITNGTRWPKHAAEFAVKHRIRQVQISFDGVGDSHNRIRRLRKGYEIAEGKSSFDAAFALVGELLQVARVDVRFNVNPMNIEQVNPFIDLVLAAGWLDMAYSCNLQPARVSMYSERSAFVRKIELSPVEFENVLDRFRELSGRPQSIQTAWFENGVAPKNSVCAALASDSIVVGAERLLYRCGLQVGEKHRAVGKLDEPRPEKTGSSTFKDSAFWDEFDPTTQPKCSQCSFLPICWGGCPKKHLEHDFHSLDETSIYFRKHLPAQVAREANAVPVEGFEFLASDQFKLSAASPTE